MKFLLVPTLIMLSFCAGVAQEWLPSIRSTEKVAIRFWQRDQSPVAFRDAVPDAVGVYQLYGPDSTTVVTRWNVPGSGGYVFLADFDGDGFNDCTTTDTVYLRTGTSQQTRYAIPRISSLAGFADIDGDGMGDVLDELSIHYGDGQRPLMRRKIITHAPGLKRPNYLVNYMDTLGSKVLFLTSWAAEIDQDENDITVAVETLDIEELQKVGDTARLRTLHAFTYRSASHTLGTVPTFIFDDVWYVFARSASLAISSDTIIKFSADPSFHSLNGQSNAIGSYRPNNDGMGNEITIVDGRKPTLIYGYEPLDTSFTLRYLTMQAHNPILKTQILGVLNVNLGPSGKTVRTVDAFCIADVDGDGIEDICNPVPLPGIQKFSYDVYLTSGKVVSSVIAQTNPMMLPVASRVDGGWLVRNLGACADLRGISQAYVYGVDGRLVVTSPLQATVHGFLLSDATITSRSVLIAVMGTCMVRLQ